VGHNQQKKKTMKGMKQKKYHRSAYDPENPDGKKD